jgi:hypothetical protein
MRYLRWQKVSCMSLGGDVACVLSGATINAAAPAKFLSFSINQLRNSPANGESETVDLSPRQQQLNQIALCLLSAVCNSLRQQGLIEPNETITVSNQTYGVDNHCIESSKNASPHEVASKIISIAGNDLGSAINLIGGNDGRICIEDFLIRCNLSIDEPLLSNADNNCSQKIREKSKSLFQQCLHLMQGTMIDFPRMAPGQGSRPWDCSSLEQMGGYAARRIENQQHMR